MAKNTLTETVADAEQVEEETIFLREDYGKCEVIESYNREDCFIRCIDKNSGEIVTEENRLVSSIIGSIKNEYEAYTKIRNFISDEKCNGFGVNTHAYAQIYSRKKERNEKQPKTKKNNSEQDQLLVSNMDFFKSQRKSPVYNG